MVRVDRASNRRCGDLERFRIHQQLAQHLASVKSGECLGSTFERVHGIDDGLEPAGCGPIESSLKIRGIAAVAADEAKLFYE